MAAQEKAAGMLLVTAPATAYKNHDCTDHFTGAQVRLHIAFIATRGALCIAALRVRGYEVVTRHADAGYDAVNQHRTKSLPDFLALEAFARSLGAPLRGDGGAA